MFLLAVVYLATSGLGFVRDLLAVRLLGFGAQADLFLTLSTFPPILLSLLGPGAYISIADCRSVFIRFYSLTIISIAAVATVFLCRDLTTYEYFFFGLILVGYVSTGLTVRDYAALATAGHTLAFGSVQAIANIFTVTSIVLLPAHPIAYAGAAAVAVPVAVRIISAFGGGEIHSRDIQGPSSLKTGTGAWPFIVVYVFLQSYSLSDRFIGLRVGEGVVSVLAIAGKFAAIPIGLVSAGVGTKLFVSLASSERGSVPILEKIARASATCRFVIGTTLLGLGAFSSIAAYLSAPLLLAATGAPSFLLHSSDLRIAFSVFFITVPFAALFGVISQELLAQADRHTYSIAGTILGLTYTVCAAAAVILRSSIVLALAAVLPYAVACFFLLVRGSRYGR